MLNRFGFICFVNFQRQGMGFAFSNKYKINFRFDILIF